MFFENPADGWLPEEKAFFRLTIIMFYKRIDNPVDKFIFMAIQENGYTQDDIAQILNISQEAVSKRYSNIKKALKESLTKKA